MGSSFSQCVAPGASYALLEAIQSRDITVINSLLAVEPGLLRYRNLRTGDTVFHVAAAAGSDLALDAMLDRAAQQGSEALQSAINARNRKGQTPLMHAAFRGHTAAVRLLLSKGADPWAHDRCGNRTALHYAAMKGCVETIETLLDGVSAPELPRYIGVRSISGLSPLHYAAGYNRPDAVRCLLARGADLLATNRLGDAYDLAAVPRQGSSPLHVAAGAGALEAAVALLQHYHEHLEGPTFRDPRRRRDAAGRTPQALALVTGHTILAEVLHPAADLQSLFSGDAVAGGGGGIGIERRGVLRLSMIASAALRQQLLSDLDKAAEVISQFRNRNPTCSSPSAMLQRQSPFARDSADTLDPDDPFLDIIPGLRTHGPCCSAPTPTCSAPTPTCFALTPTCSAPTASCSASTASCSVPTPTCSAAPNSNAGCCPSAATPSCSAPNCCASSATPGSPPSCCPPTAIPSSNADCCHPPADSSAPPAHDPNPSPCRQRSCPPPAAPPCCAVRERPNRFVCRSANFLDTEYRSGTVLPVAQCAVCLDDAYCVLGEPCHHRLCTDCARDVVQRSPAMPLPCPVCRVTVHQFTSPVC